MKYCMNMINEHMNEYDYEYEYEYEFNVIYGDKCISV